MKRLSEVLDWTVQQFRIAFVSLRSPGGAPLGCKGDRCSLTIPAYNLRFNPLARKSAVLTVNGELTPFGSVNPDRYVLSRLDTRAMVTRRSFAWPRRSHRL